MIRRLGLAILAAWLVLVLELGVVASLNWSRIASVWELTHGALFAAPLALGAAAVLGAVGLNLVLLLLGSRAASFRWLLAGLLAVFAALVAWGVGGGRHLALLPARLGFALVVGALAGGAVFLLARPARQLAAKRPLGAAFVTALGIALLELANQRLLVRLYPAFHQGLSIFALLVAPLLAMPWLLAQGGTRTPRWPWAVVGLSLLLAVASPYSARRLANFDNFRLVMLERAPLMARAVELAALLAPPPALDDCEGAGCGEVALARDGARTLDLAGRDLLLVTIDALRADHVGAYGYQRATTPELDRLAATGVVFEHAYAPTPHTSYSVTSLMTGKYMRPLLLQNTGHDSDTLAGLLRTYGYRTAAFYPPAVFFIDQKRFERFEREHLGFEYRWVEFAEGERRLNQLKSYVDKAPRDKPLFVWVHLFGPHEPYEAHEQHAFGERDIDRYDSEIAAADATFGMLLNAFRAARPGAAVLLTADHGEEFGDHGGRYHGTTVYEEQVRVPLVIDVPGVTRPHRVSEPVQTIDLLPTILSALSVPRPPRLRGRDLGGLLTGKQPAGPGLAYAETEEQALYAEGDLRLICARRVGACQLFDVKVDPAQTKDLARDRARDLEGLRRKLQELGASHGRYEATGLRAEGKGWPAAILRAIAGDGDAAEELAGMLDDADLLIRRKAAELLFELKRPEAAAALRLALGRDEDEDVRRWSALALTRLGEGAPLAVELSASSDPKWRRLAALALAESGDKRGQAELIAWWQDESTRDFERSRQLLTALGALRTKDAVYPLLKSLDDVRLRPHVAGALARIGDEGAIGPLLVTLRDERSQSSRHAIVEALVALGAREELAAPLTRFLGVPDPLADGVGLAQRAGILQHLGGVKESDRRRVSEQSDLGVTVPVVVPAGGNGRGVRLLVRARARGDQPGEFILGSAAHLTSYDRRGELKRQRGLPSLDTEHAVRVAIAPSAEPREVWVTLPASLGARPGLSTRFVIYGGRDTEIEAFAIVPLADELPPPAPKPWEGEGP